jgi:hypothetical protein
MYISHALIVSFLAIFGLASVAHANSCSNVNVIGTYDESGIRDNEFGISAVGTFRIAEESDESKQPMFNLTRIDCQKDENGSLECKVTSAVVYANPDKPNTDQPNCSLDLDYSDYLMKELQKGILVGSGSSGICYNVLLTIDRKAQRVYQSFTRSEGADNADKIRPGTCGHPPRTQVLMNCTGWPKSRKQGPTPARYCDFSGSSSR